MRARLILLTLIPFLLPAKECCTLGGTVVDSVTREPVRRALVYARNLSGATVQRTLGATATTDASGRFAFSALDPGRYSISAERSGFVTCNYGATPRPSCRSAAWTCSVRAGIPAVEWWHRSKSSSGRTPVRLPEP